jgi:2-dehydropantoate 2-reductase
MRVGIIGVGALGCLLASRLTAVDGLQLIMLGHWREQLLALRQKGLVVQELDGSHTQHLVEVTDTPVGQVDMALVAVKSYQTRSVARPIAQWLKPHGVAVSLQNGLGNRETLAAFLGAGRVAVGTTAHGATLIKPGYIRHAGAGETYLEEAGAELAVWLRQAGWSVQTTAVADSLLWGKLLINAAINPLTALLRQPNGYLCQDAQAAYLAQAAAQEVAAVAQAKGIPLPYAYAEAGRVVLAVCENTAVNHSSMYQDVRRHAPTEIEAITGQVVAHGQQIGIPTPANNVLLRFMRIYEEYRQANLPTYPISLSNLVQLYEEEKTRDEG